MVVVMLFLIGKHVRVSVSKPLVCALVCALTSALQQALPRSIYILGARVCAAPLPGQPRRRTDEPKPNYTWI